MVRTTLATLVGVLVLLAPPARAQAAEAGPAARPPLRAVVKVVEGTVETRPGPDQPWAPVAVGMQLAEGSDLRTGFRARCVVDMVDSLVQADALTLLRIAELRWEGDKARTRIHLKQGNTRSEVEKPRMKSDFAIVTPSAVLSVRGTKGIECGFFPDRGGRYALATSGLIAVADRLTQAETGVRPGQQTDDRATRPMERLVDRHVSVALDQTGLEQKERLVSARWDLPMAQPDAMRQKRRREADRATLAAANADLAALLYLPGTGTLGDRFLTGR